MGYLVFLVIVVAVVVVLRIKKKGKIEELKDSNSYAVALDIKKMLEEMGKGCNFGEPKFSIEVGGYACANFESSINIPSETEKSDIKIYTTKYKVPQESRMENLVFCASSSSGFFSNMCILDAGRCIVYSYKNSPELLDGVFKKLCDSFGGNVYVKGKLINEPSDELPVYPKR
jgi:hypothetical protein